MSALKIGVHPNRSGLDFDLADVLTAVGAHPNLDWVLREPQILWPDDVVPDEFTFDRPDNPLTWAAMQRLAAAVLQVVDAMFVGYDAHGRAVLSIAAVDSSFWIVWSRDAPTLDGVRAHFEVVQNYDMATVPPDR